MMLQVSEQLLLRTYQPEDAPELFRCVQQNRAHLREFLPWVDTTLKEADSLSFITNMDMLEQQQRGVALGIFLDGTLIGGIGMHEWDHYLQKCQIGYWLAAPAEGHGYMLQSAVCFISFLFGTLGMNKVEIHFLPYNQRSSALTKRLGARTEGVIRASYRLHGALEDIVVTGILKREWQPGNVLKR